MSNVPIVSKKRAGSKKSQSQSAGSPFPRTPRNAEF